MGALSFGGKIVVDNVFDKTEQNADDEKFVPGTYGAYFDRVRTITPFLIAHLIATEGVRADNDGMHYVYDDYNGQRLYPGQTPKGNATIGFGATVLKDGSRVTSYTKPITTEEAYELARWHLEEGETYLGMYCYDVAFDAVNVDSADEALGIGSVMYNSFANLMEEPSNLNCQKRFARLRELYKEYGRAVTDEMVQEIFL